MSAIIGLRSSDAIRVLTDAATTMIHDGRVAEIRRKQALTRSGVLVSGVGLWAPCARLVALIDGMPLDEVAPALEHLWNRASDALPESAFEIPFATLVAGWSNQRKRLELHCVRSWPRDDDPTRRDPETIAVMEDIVCYVGGPSIEAGCVIDPTIARLGADPDAFDVRRDGLEFMETMRRNYPRPFDVGRQPAVGGFVQLTTLTPTGAKSEVLRHWPDRVGYNIDPSKDEIADPNELRDANWGGATLADLYRMRDALVAGMSDRVTRPQLTAADWSKVADVLAGQMAREAMN